MGRARGGRRAGVGRARAQSRGGRGAGHPEGKAWWAVSQQRAGGKGSGLWLGGGRFRLRPSAPSPPPGSSPVPCGLPGRRERHCEMTRASPIRSKILQLDVYKANEIDYVL